MTITLDAITLGVTDPLRARSFYQDGLGGVAEDDRDGHVTLDLGPKASTLVLAGWDALADEAGLPPATSGFRGFTLSCILDTAAAVDDALARLVRCGGVVSKPARNALWGYSAYVTDPNGYLWKIASSKRRRFIGKERSPADVAEAEFAAVRDARDITITIGVADMKRATQFYRDGLGLPVDKDYRKFVSFSGGTGSSDLAMYQWDALADDADASASGSGFRGLALSHSVDTPRHVEALLDAAGRAGGTIVTPAFQDQGSAYLADPDGHLWRVISAPANSNHACPVSSGRPRRATLFPAAGRVEPGFPRR